jgi:hypothetical protein
MTHEHYAREKLIPFRKTKFARAKTDLAMSHKEITEYGLFDVTFMMICSS